MLHTVVVIQYRYPGVLECGTYIHTGLICTYNYTGTVLGKYMYKARRYEVRENKKHETTS